MGPVSIRFKVRGGFRPVFGLMITLSIAFQSALRFAVVSDYGWDALEDCSAGVSIRFKVRGGFRPEVRGGIDTTVVSIRFKVRGGFRPYPLARRPDKPCCGGFTHHPSSPPPTSGQNLS